MGEGVDPRRAGIERFRARKAGGVAPADQHETADDDDTEAPTVPTVRTVGLAPPPKTPVVPPPVDEPMGEKPPTDEDGPDLSEAATEAATTFTAVPATDDQRPTAGTSTDDPHLVRARTVAAGLGAGVGARLGVRATRSDHPDPAEYGRRIGNMRGVSTTVSAKTAERLDKQATAKNQTLSRAAMDAVRNHYRTVLADLAPEQDPDDPFGTPPVSPPRENYGVRKEFSVTPQEAETLARLAYDAGISPAALLRTCIERDTDPAASRNS